MRENSPVTETCKPICLQGLLSLLICHQDDIIRFITSTAISRYQVDKSAWRVFDAAGAVLFMELSLSTGYFQTISIWTFLVSIFQTSNYLSNSQNSFRLPLDAHHLHCLTINSRWLLKIDEHTKVDDAKRSGSLMGSSPIWPVKRILLTRLSVQTEHFFRWKGEKFGRQKPFDLLAYCNNTVYRK